MSSLYSTGSDEELSFGNRTSNTNFQERLLEAQLQQNTNQPNATVVRLHSSLSRTILNYALVQPPHIVLNTSLCFDQRHLLQWDNLDPLREPTMWQKVVGKLVKYELPILSFVLVNRSNCAFKKITNSPIWYSFVFILNSANYKTQQISSL